MSNIGNFLPLSRTIQQNFLWESEDAFCERAAWIDLLLTANYSKKTLTRREKGRTIKWRRGQVFGCQRFLMKRWKWKSLSKIQNFLKMLVKEGMISIDTTQGVTIITISNYEKYNYPGQKKINHEYDEELSGPKLRDRDKGEFDDELIHQKFLRESGKSQGKSEIKEEE